MRTTSTSIGLTALRIVLGVVFIAHGAQKFTQGIPGVAQGFAGMGVPLAEVAAPLVAGLELVGGILLVLGVATRVVGLLLAVDMVVAGLLAHATAGSSPRRAASSTCWCSPWRPSPSRSPDPDGSRSTPSCCAPRDGSAGSGSPSPPES